MHVDDLGEACVFLLENWLPEENEQALLNVGTGEDMTVKDLAIAIAKATGYKGEIRWDKTKPDGTPRKILDVSRINKLGWKAKISLEEGLERTIREYADRETKEGEET